MNIVPLEAIPNQELTLRLDDDRYRIRLNNVADDCMCATIYRNDVLIISGVRATANTMLIQYQYLATGSGNFAFVTPNGELPDYVNFGTTHVLIYYDIDEMSAF